MVVVVVVVLFLLLLRNDWWWVVVVMLLFWPWDAEVFHFVCVQNIDNIIILCCLV